MVPSPRRGISLALVAAVFGALFVIPYRRATDLNGGGHATFALLLCAALQTSVAVLWQSRSQNIALLPSRFALSVGCVLAIFSSTGNYLSALGLSYVPPAIHSVILRSEVIFVGILGAALLSERPTLRFTLGALVALLGLCLININPQQPQFAWGALGGVGAAVCFSAMQVVLKRYIQRLDPIGINCVRLWLSTLVMALVPGVLGALAGSRLFWTYSFVAALCGPTISRLFTIASLRHLPAAFGPLVLLLAPILVFPLAYILDGSVPTRLQTLGSLVLLAGVSLPVVEALKRVRTPLAELPAEVLTSQQQAQREREISIPPSA